MNQQDADPTSRTDPTPRDDLAPRDDLTRLRADLARRAEASGDLDISYREVDGPLGRLLVAATPAGLLRVAFPGEGVDAVLTDLAARVSPRILHGGRRLDEPARELEEYLEGRRRSFDLPLDLSLLHGFRREVVASALPRIRYGQTASYAQVAALADRPRAVRAVGTACARNPLPLVLPCHRVVRSDGTPGAYRGGPEAKRQLLDLEAAAG